MWGEAVVARLRAARLNPPSADNVVDLVEAAARRGVAMSPQRSGRVSVQARGDKILVQAQGPVRPAVRAEVLRSRPAIERKLRDLARAKIRSR